MSKARAPSPLPTAPMEGVDESTWLDVIQKMDEVYTRLIDDEVELEKKNSELEQSQQFIFSVLSAMSDVLIVCDERGLIEQTNAALCELVGRREEQLRGSGLADLLADEASVQAARAAMDRGEAPHGGQGIELNLLDRQGQPVPVDANCTPRIGANGKRLGTVWVGRPTAELKRAYHEMRAAHEALKRTQQQLLHSEKMASLGQLVAGVAHELNNPIGFVHANLQLLDEYVNRLLQPGLDPEKRRKTQEAIAKLLMRSREGTERVKQIVQDLRTFSRTDQAELQRERP